MEPVIFAVYTLHTFKGSSTCLKIIGFPFIFHPFSCSYHSIFICIIELIVHFKQTVFIKSTCLRRKVIFFIVQFCPACNLFTVYIIEGISVFFFQAVLHANGKMSIFPCVSSYCRTVRCQWLPPWGYYLRIIHEAEIHIHVIPYRNS